MIMNPEVIERFRYISSQAKDQKVSSYQGLLSCRYGYGRAIEKVNQGEFGRNFLGINIKDDTCNFTLCKGIGEDGHKGLAARYIGNMLMDWLDITEDWSSAEFQSYLHNIPPLSIADVNNEIRSNVSNSEFMRVFLDEQPLHNSDVMYICGRIELPTLDNPIGRIWMAWQGDTRLRFWRDGLEVSQFFNETMTENEWWSANHGTVGGSPHVYQSRLEYGMPMRLLLYTEALSDLDPIRDWLPDEQVQILFDAPHTNGLREDAAYLEFAW
ncbi:hypothetical protein D3C76_1078510 [compost metagenome]